MARLIHQEGFMKLRALAAVTTLTCAVLGVPVAHSQPRAKGPVVSTASGRVAGVQLAHSDLAVFKGIPFAAPPTGKLRWRAPQPVHAWKGIRPADHFSDSCMQQTPNEFLPWTPVFMTHRPVSEDCLYLNVWTPRVSASANLPVLVFIHGGAFTSGAGSISIYNGAHLAETGMVVVTLNYRVGVFGFFAYPQLTAESRHHSSGNYGLLDQIAALGWVRRNIRNFGGDPHRVTIWGQSAGAWSVEDLLLSPLPVGLFERAQADSGIGLANGFHSLSLRQAEANGEKFATRIGAHSLAELRAVPAAALLADVRPGDRFLPNVDGWVLPAASNQLTAQGTGSHVPVITGNEANDWMLGSPRVHTVQQYQALAHRLYGSEAAQFLQLYPAANAEQAAAMETLSSEDRDRVSMYLWARLRAQSPDVTQPIYTYYFDRAIPWPQHPEYGAFHSGELPYFFRNLNRMHRPWQPADFAVSRTVSAYLKNFVATGDPNGAGLPHWPAVQAKSAVTMQLGQTMGPMPLASAARLAFWKKYFASPDAAHAPLF